MREQLLSYVLIALVAACEILDVLSKILHEFFLRRKKI